MNFEIKPHPSKATDATIHITDIGWKVAKYHGMTFATLNGLRSATSVVTHEIMYIPTWRSTEDSISDEICRDIDEL